MIKNRKMLIVITTFAVLIMTGIVATYAYFQIEEDRGIIISTGDFHVEMFVYFDGELVTMDSDYYDMDKGVVIVNTFDETSDNYIEDLDIYVDIDPIVASRYRFKIKQEWELQRYYLNQAAGDEIDPVFQSIYFDNYGLPYYPFSQLTFPSGFTPLFDTEGYVYSTDIILTSDTPTNVHLIDGGDPYLVRTNDAIEEFCYLYFDIEFDIVQANRFSEVWGIDPTFYN